MSDTIWQTYRFCRGFADRAIDIGIAERDVIRAALQLGKLQQEQDDLLCTAKPDLVDGVYVVDGGKVIILDEKIEFISGKLTL